VEFQLYHTRPNFTPIFVHVDRGRGSLGPPHVRYVPPVLQMTSCISWQLDDLMAANFPSRQHPISALPFPWNALCVAAPIIWVILSLQSHEYTIPDTFRHHLKTHYFQQVFKPTWRLPLAPRIRLRHVCKLFVLTYLLTSVFLP